MNPRTLITTLLLAGIGLPGTPAHAQAIEPVKAEATLVSGQKVIGRDGHWYLESGEPLGDDIVKNIFWLLKSDTQIASEDRHLFQNITDQTARNDLRFNCKHEIKPFFIHEVFLYNIVFDPYGNAALIDVGRSEEPGIFVVYEMVDLRFLDLSNPRIREVGESGNCVVLRWNCKEDAICVMQGTVSTTVPQDIFDALGEALGDDSGIRWSGWPTTGIYLPDKSTAEEITALMRDAQKHLPKKRAMIEGEFLREGQGAAKTPERKRSTSASAPACGREWRIEPASMPCGSRWAPPGDWPKRLWCYTDYNMQIGGDPGVTYCTNGVGTWQRSALFDRCNGVEGWCD